MIANDAESDTIRLTKFIEETMRMTINFSRPFHYLAVLMLFGAVFVYNQACAADDLPMSTSRPSDYVVPANPYGQGLWTGATYGGYAVQPGGGIREQIGFGTVGINYFLFDNISLGAELTGLHACQPGMDAIAGGGDFIVRSHFYNARQWSLFTDFALGVLEANHQLPPGGTDFNFTIQTGVGATMRLWDRTELLAGVRYLHISNAHQEGGERNPSTNAIDGYIGLMFRF
ncbi:MAG: acyloxyacyl hydrolase [Planctomycetota bacterium]|nr:acyloxyacyl hydrolase [Planctomycetota bacterium]